MDLNYAWALVWIRGAAASVNKDRSKCWTQMADKKLMNWMPEPSSIGGGGARRPCPHQEPSPPIGTAGHGVTHWSLCLKSNYLSIHPPTHPPIHSWCISSPGTDSETLFLRTAPSSGAALSVHPFHPPVRGDKFADSAHVPSPGLDLARNFAGVLACRDQTPLQRLDGWTHALAFMHACIAS